ncbi:hypothetical protein ACTQ49_10140 [Luteococcus sp. Sow4_B9]|uniref:hypothetical protein n=1 Tax=Luteococcus sp. Sow4_B9 TaxID=3438792 RepID=UPI003F9619A5
MNINDMLTDFSGGIPTNAREFPILVKLDGANSGNEREKTSPDGRKTYSVAGTVMSVRDGEPMAMKNCFINTIEPVTAGFDLFATTLLRAEGKIWVKAFESNGRVSYSITAEKLVPVNLSQEKAA